MCPNKAFGDVYKVKVNNQFGNIFQGSDASTALMFQAMQH